MGRKNASFHHNYLTHVQNRAPRFNGARYSWGGYDQEKYENTVDAERVDFRNCVIYNWGDGNGCYGGPGGGYINIVNNYYKAGPGTKNKTRVTEVSVASSGNADKKHPELYGLSSRYFINGNYVTAAGDKAAFYDWSGVKYDSGIITQNGEKYMPDPKHQFGKNVDYVTINEKDHVKLKLDAPIDPGTVTTHTAEQAYEKVLAFVGSSLYRDAVDVRYMEEARTGTTTYKDIVGWNADKGKYQTNPAGILNIINNPEGEENYTTASFPALASNERAADFDTDRDGMDDEWELKNGLDPNNPDDANLYTVDAKGIYTNVEVYLNQLVEDIMKGGNADAITGVDEYYPECVRVSSVETIGGVSSEVAAIEYYSLDGVRLASPADGISIRRTVFADGTVKTDKVIKR